MFDPEKVVGLEHVTTITRYMCKLCKQLITSELELHSHLKSRGHWDKCVEGAAAEGSTTSKVTPKKSASTGDDEDEDEDENDSENDVEMEDNEMSGGKRKKVASNAAEAKKKK